MLIKEFESLFDFEKTLQELERSIDNIKGWHVTDRVDQSKEINAHGGQFDGKMQLIKFCNPHYSSAMLQDDDRKIMGAIMPKTFAVYTKANGKTYLATINGNFIAGHFDAETQAIMQKVAQDIKQVLAKLVRTDNSVLEK